jgi:hypothetical protein
MEDESQSISQDGGDFVTKSTSDGQSSSQVSSTKSSVNTFSEVRGPEGQMCESKYVLDQILQKYSHISANVFKGGATGKIKSEYMICECRYNHGKR